MHSMVNRHCYMQVSMADTRFPKGHKEAWQHAYFQPRTIQNSNICHAEKLILQKRQIIVHVIASNSGKSVGHAETIIHEHLLLMKVWVW